MDYGTMAQGAGSLISAVGGLFGNDGASFKDMKKQGDASYVTSRKMALNMPSHMKKGWEKAGIHPIYGMGGSSASFSPSFSVGGSGSSVGEKMSNIGQNISRAAEAFASKGERDLSHRLLEAQIEGQELENAKKASDLRLKTLPGTPPGLSVPGRPGLKPGSTPAAQRHQMQKGHQYLPSEEWSQSAEGAGEVGQAILFGDWVARNAIPLYRDDVLKNLAKRTTPAGRRVNRAKGYRKFTTMARELYNKYIN